MQATTADRQLRTIEAYFDDRILEDYDWAS